MSALVMTADAQRRAAGLPVILLAAIALTTGIALDSDVLRADRRAVTDGPSPIAALPLRGGSVSAYGRTSSTEPFPIRWQLRQPIPYADGAWIFAGFMANNFTSAATDIRLEITFPSGEVLVYLIASDLLPGERVPYELRLRRGDIDGWQARARFSLREWPANSPNAP